MWQKQCLDFWPKDSWTDGITPCPASAISSKISETVDVSSGMVTSKRNKNMIELIGHVSIMLENEVMGTCGLEVNFPPCQNI